MWSQEDIHNDILCLCILIGKHLRFDNGLSHKRSGNKEKGEGIDQEEKYFASFVLFSYENYILTL